MIIKHTNDKTTSPCVGSNLKGLKIDAITLDYEDIQDLLSKNSEVIIRWLLDLSTSMYKVKPITVYTPIDEDNRKLKREGKDYICRAITSR
jgi:hypothetical protein